MYVLQTIFTYYGIPVGKIAEKAVWKSAFLLIQHSKYMLYCQKYTPTDYFFSDFAH